MNINLHRRMLPAPGSNSSRRRTLGVCGAVCAGLLVYGAASAAIPSTNGVIHACYRTSGTHALQVIDASKQSCPLNTRSLSWNQTGPPGPRGPQGRPGVTSAWHATHLDSTYLPNDSSYVSAVETAPMPPGNYIVNAATTAVPDSSGDEVNCGIGAGGGPGSFLVRASTDGTSAISLPLATTGAFRLTHYERLHLWCQSKDGSANSRLDWSSITAIAVDVSN